MHFARNDIPPDLLPLVSLWNAVLMLVIDDARDFVRKGPGKDGSRAAAYDDLMSLGPMTQHLARFCIVTPEFIGEQFRISLQQDRRRWPHGETPPEEQISCW